MRRIESFAGHLSARNVAVESAGVDLKRYPIHDLSSERGAALLARARRDLATSGCASFPGFFTPDATKEAAAEARRLSPTAFVTDALHNAYQLPEHDASYSSDHVRNLQMRTRVASVAYDELGGPLRSLYQCDAVLDFIGAVTERRLYRLADPLGACTINVFRKGWYHAWHFDEAEFTTTLCLQQSEEGGEFEYSLPLRSNQDDLAERAVANIVRSRSAYNACGGSDGADGEVSVATAKFSPGTLQIFGGRYSLHRVKKISETSSRERLVAVLCFATEPGVVNSESVQRMFWGRTAVRAKQGQPA